MIPIRTQMEFIRKYVELQRFRYDNSFDALVEYDEQVADCLIPKMLIQPLVENAILHGVRMEDKNGMITVIAHRRDGDVCIRIEDNGVGMTREHIREIMNTRVSSGRVHLGVRNVYERIRLYFGEDYGLSINSAPGEGTQITLLIPVLEEGAVSVRDTPGL